MSARTVAGDDYLQFCGSLRDLCGIDLTQYKRTQMERRLRSFFSRRGVTRLTDSIDDLRRDPAALDELLDRITINVTQLWRNPAEWELLEREILPELDSASGTIRAWSAGCSYGAEAYTLAAICQLSGRVRTKITGTDIDKRMVARARSGIFSDADARDAPLEQVRQSFDRVEQGWQAKPALRRMTSFELGDLLRTTPPRSHFDLILCRNTVIYFDEPIRDALHARLAQALRPGGYLMIGLTERVADPDAVALQKITKKLSDKTHSSVYRKA